MLSCSDRLKRLDKIMEISIDFTLLLLCLLVVIFLAVVHMKNRVTGSQILPPSARCYPVIGNLHLLTANPHEVFLRLSSTLGPVFSFWFSHKRVVVVNDYESAKEVLATKDNFLAGRPQRYTGDLYSNGFKGIIVTDYTKELVSRRKVVHSALRLYNDGLSKLEELIDQECKSLVKNLREASLNHLPVDPKGFIPLAVTNVICGLAFGSRYLINDPEFRKIIEINEWIMQGIASAPKVDAIPMARFFPNKTLSNMKKAVALRNEILERKLREHEETFNPCIVRDLMDSLLSHLDADPDERKVLSDREAVKMIIGDMFIAATETTSAALLWCVLYFAAFPEVQSKIQKQIDSAIEQGKSFSTAGKSMCPFLMASIYEVLRLANVSPVGLPHKAVRNTSIKGFDIAKDTVVLVNLFALHNDSVYWPNPSAFRPERFLDTNGNLVEHSQSYFPFSSGRRGCIGEKFAKIELFLILFSLLRNFSISKPSPNYVFDFKGEYHSTISPKPFQIIFVARQ